MDLLEEVEKFCDREQICIIKLISDNKNNSPIEFISKTRLYINQNLKNIEKTIDEYIDVASNIDKKSKINLDFIQKKFNLTFLIDL